MDNQEQYIKKIQERINCDWNPLSTAHYYSLFYNKRFSERELEYKKLEEHYFSHSTKEDKKAMKIWLTLTVVTFLSVLVIDLSLYYPSLQTPIGVYIIFGFFISILTLVVLLPEIKREVRLNEKYIVFHENNELQRKISWKRCIYAYFKKRERSPVELVIVDKNLNEFYFPVLTGKIRYFGLLICRFMILNDKDKTHHEKV